MGHSILASLAALPFAAAAVALAPGAARAGMQSETQCIELSAHYNALPFALLLAIRLQEDGRVGAWRLNRDGSADYGVMQINSRWLPLLAQEGYTARVLVYDACASIAAGAWILAKALARHGAWGRPDADPHAYWRAVGDYHSRTPARNRAYAEQVWRRYQRLVARQ